MWNSTLPVEKRVKDLVGRLTLEEKVRFELNADQLMLVDTNGKLFQPAGELLLSIHRRWAAKCEAANKL